MYVMGLAKHRGCRGVCVGYKSACVCKCVDGSSGGVNASKTKKKKERKRQKK